MVHVLKMLTMKFMAACMISDYTAKVLKNRHHQQILTIGKYCRETGGLTKVGWQ